MSSGPRQIIHMDMDAFFASVEQRDQPQLRGKPVLVGGPSKRGVVAAASYEARKFGVHSAMPMVEALRRCPQAVVVPGNHGRYGEVSAQVFAIFRRYTPLVEGLSLDEAFLDVTGSQKLFGDGVAIAQAIRRAVYQELQLTVSAGVARSKFVAKIASDMNKPNGITVVPQNVAAFLAPLPVERMWGIGPVAARTMHEAGLRTIGDLAASSPEELTALLGKWGAQVHQLARGIDEREVNPDHEAKSVGAEHTFESDITRPEDLHPHLLNQAARVARRLHGQGIQGRVVTLKVKFANFTLRTARTTLPQPVSNTDSIYRAAVELLARMDLQGRGVRLTGVSVSELSRELSGGPVQRDLFGDAEVSRREAIEDLTAKIRNKFGEGSLLRATLVRGPPR